MAEIESSSAANNPISPFYGNLFQRIQFHGIVINRTKNDLLPFDACCPSLQSKLPTRTCSICKQYIPSSIRLRQHYKIHQEQYASNFIDYNNNANKVEEIVDDNDLHDPYDMSLVSLHPTQNSVCLFTDMIEWLKSDFEDDPIVDTKVKSIAANASAMIRKDKQMAASSVTTTTTITTTTTSAITTAGAFDHRQIKASLESRTTAPDDTQSTTTTELTLCVDSQLENGSVLDAMEQLAVIDDGTSSIGNPPSQEGWDDLEDLIDKI